MARSQPGSHRGAEGRGWGWAVCQLPGGRGLAQPSCADRSARLPVTQHSERGPGPGGAGRGWPSQEGVLSPLCLAAAPTPTPPCPCFTPEGGPHGLWGFGDRQTLQEPPGPRTPSQAAVGAPASWAVLCGATLTCKAQPLLVPTCEHPVSMVQALTSRIWPHWAPWSPLLSLPGLLTFPPKSLPGCGAVRMPPPPVFLPPDPPPPVCRQQGIFRPIGHNLAPVEVKDISHWSPLLVAVSSGPTRGLPF